MLKVLQVWADWFLFSDSYVNGLRATFLRPGNSGVPAFHTLCGDLQAVKENGTTIEVGGDFGVYLAEGADASETGQDAALAIGEGAAARELSSLPVAELERRCKHNGLSIRGGTEVMVARLLSLEEAEKQKNQEQEEEMRAAHGLYVKQSVAVAKEGSDSALRVRGDEVKGRGWTELGSGWREVSRYDRVLQDDSENGSLDNGTTQVAQPWSVYSGTEEVEMKESSKRDEGSAVALSSGVGPSTLAIPLPDLKAFGESKAERVLPASKWTRDEGSSDDEIEGDVKVGLGLGYSSSGSEDFSKGAAKGEKQEVHSVLDTTMDEERRFVSTNCLWSLQVLAFSGTFMCLACQLVTSQRTLLMIL